MTAPPAGSVFMKDEYSSEPRAGPQCVHSSQLLLSGYFHHGPWFSGRFYGPESRACCSQQDSLAQLALCAESLAGAPGRPSGVTGAMLTPQASCSGWEMLGSCHGCHVP